MSENSKRPFKEHPRHIGCDFGWNKEKFNLNKRDIRNLSAEARAALNKPTKTKGKPIKDEPPPPPPPQPSTTAVFLLDFTGHTVTGTAWNYSGDIVCTPAHLLSEEVDVVIANIKDEYSPYNVIVT